MTEMTLWEEILWGWIIITILPKLGVIPVWRWMLQAARDTERQDELDAAWLASLRGGGSGGTPRRHRRLRPWGRGPRGGPRGGGAAMRIAPRPPRRVDARGRRAPLAVPAR